MRQTPLHSFCICFFVLFSFWLSNAKIYAQQAQSQYGQWQPPQSIVGIDFFQGTWEEAQLYAKQMDKFIFVDIYSKGCKPCERMEDVFRLTDVARLHNVHFVNFKMDGLLPEHQLFREYIGEMSFPIFVYTDASGTALEVQIGETSAEQLISIAKKAINNDYKNTKAWWERKSDDHGAVTENSPQPNPTPQPEQTAPIHQPYTSQTATNNNLPNWNSGNDAPYATTQTEQDKKTASGSFNGGNGEALDRSQFKKMDELMPNTPAQPAPAPQRVYKESEATNTYRPETTHGLNTYKPNTPQAEIGNLSDAYTKVEPVSDPPAAAPSNPSPPTSSSYYGNSQASTYSPTYESKQPIKSTANAVSARQLAGDSPEFARLKDKMLPFKKLAPHDFKLERLAELRQDYEAGNSNHKELMEYAYLLKEQRQAYNEVVNTVFSSPNYNGGDDIFNFAYDFAINTENKAIDYIIEHLELYKKIKRGKELNQRLKTAIRESVLHASELRDNGLFERTLTFIKNVKIADEARFTFDMQTLYYANINDWDNYTRIAKQYIDKLKITDPYLLNDVAWMYHQYVSENRKLQHAREWATLSVQTISNYENNYTLAAVLYKLGEVELALRTAQQAIAIAQTHGGDYARAERLIDKIYAESK
jgi:hypothetical protein